MLRSSPNSSRPRLPALTLLPLVAPELDPRLVSLAPARGILANTRMCSHPVADPSHMPWCSSLPVTKPFTRRSGNLIFFFLLLSLSLLLLFFDVHKPELGRPSKVLHRELSKNLFSGSCTCGLVRHVIERLELNWNASRPSSCWSKPFRRSKQMTN